MCKTETDFKMAFWQRLEVRETEIIEENDKLLFRVNGKYKNKEYSIDFLSFLTKKDLLEFEIGKRIDFKQHIDQYDVIFKENKLFSILENYEMNIERYTKDNFLLEVKFNDGDILGVIEITFSF